MEIWVEELAAEATYFRCTGNLGQGGVYFERAIPHAVGTTVNLRFRVPGDEALIFARGEVVSASRDAVGMGLKFIDFEDDGHERLQRYVEQVEQVEQAERG